MMPGERQLPLDLGHRPALGADDFLVAECNRDAVAWIDSWPNWPAPLLTIYGPPGCGKTHLAQVWRGRNSAPSLGLADLYGVMPRDLLGGGRCCVLDMADENETMTGVAAETLLHLYNVVAEKGGQMVLTARQAPSRWHVPLADLASRLTAAPAVGIAAPDDDLIAAVLVKLFADRQLPIESRTLEFLLARMERSFAAARHMVARLDAAALASKRRVTIPLARECLEIMGKE